MSFEATFIDEPQLVFGNQKEEKDPRIGLEYYGPYVYSDEKSSLAEIKVGIIGDRSCLDKAARILRLIYNEIPSQQPNKWLFPSFPGVRKNTSFKCEINTTSNWQEIIAKSEVEPLVLIPNANQRIARAVDLFLGKIASILKNDDHPHLIICCVPDEIEEYCGVSERTRGAKTAKLSPTERLIEELKADHQTFLDAFSVEVLPSRPPKKSFDFHNALKGKAMAINPAVPLQILRESTMDAMLDYDATQKSVRQDPASFAWNFSTALYYKANGKPWRLAKLRQDTCYIGISFFRDKNSARNDLETSMAQVFTHNGEGLVLRGEEVYTDSLTKEPHLSQAQACLLVKNALAEYESKARRYPSRVVIHKETLFSDAEKKGCTEAIGRAAVDFVTINERTSIKFCRKGMYPVLRGTFVKLTSNRYILYSSGYTPRIRTYPGNSIPKPLHIVHDGDSNIADICREIIGLTKLNWNTTSFSTSYPITLEFSKKVGKIMSELDKNAKPQNHYRFYM